MSEAAQEVPSTENSRAIFTRLDTEFHESYVTHKTMTPNGVTITEVWEKHDLEDSRLTVERERRTGQLRVVKKILVDDHGRSRRRFYSGLEQLHAISLELEKRHSFFVLYLGWYEGKGLAFLSTQFMENGNLAQYLHSSASTAKNDAEQITMQILEGLVFLHGKNLYHGNLKPTNVLVSSLSPIQVKLADYAIPGGSRARGGISSYRAPETLGVRIPVPPSKVSIAATDLWSLGCIVHRILTSEDPFQLEALNSPGIFDDDSETEEMNADVDLIRLSEFCAGKIPLPKSSLKKARASSNAIDFVQQLLDPFPASRISAANAFHTKWIREFITIQGYRLDVSSSEGDIITVGEQGDKCRKLKWRRSGRIGQGGFGSVWLWKRDGSKKNSAHSPRWAIKSLHREFYESRGIDFKRELSALIEVRNYEDLFVKFIGWYDNRMSIYLVMEFVKFGDLGQFLDRHPREAKLCAQEISRQLLEGLAVLHERFICHRDLKPQNVLIASKEPMRVKLCDFGVSKSTIHSKLLTRCGTSGYMAPELQGILPRRFRASKDDEHTNAVDMWSLGCITHQILTSETPFLDSAPPMDPECSGVGTVVRETDMKLFTEFCNHPNEFPMDSLRNAEVGEIGINFVRRLLEPDPRSRITASQALKSEWLCDDICSSGKESDLDNNVIRNQLSSLGYPVSQRTADYLIMQSQGLREKEGGYLPSAVLTDIENLRFQAVRHGYCTLLDILLKIRVTNLPGLQPSALEWRLISEDLDGNTNWQHEINLHGIPKVDDSPMRCERTLLQAAAEEGQMSIVQLLLSKHVDVNAIPGDLNGRTALQAAAGGGHLEITKLLLAQGAAVNASPSKIGGRTALQAAAERGNLEVIQLLLQSGANIKPEPCEPGGQTAMQAAAKNGHFKIVEVLIKNGARIDCDLVCTHHRTALLEAAEQGHQAIVGLLLHHGAEPNIATNSRTALQGAAVQGNLGVVQLLLQKGAKINQSPVTDGGLTALQAASSGGWLEEIEFLISEGAEVNARAGERYGRTALQAAAENGHLEVVKHLLAVSADINAHPAQYGGRTALQAAAEGGYRELVDLLLNTGAMVNARASESEGRTALQAAAGTGHLEVVKLLLQHNAEINSNPVRCEGRTALQAAAERGHHEVVELLVKSGVEVNAKPGNASGLTAIQAAAASGNIKVAKFLLEHGGDVNAESSELDGRTALQAALESDNSADMVQLLLEHDADVHATSSSHQGHTVLQIARDRPSPEIEKILLQWIENDIAAEKQESSFSIEENPRNSTRLSLRTVEDRKTFQFPGSRKSSGRSAVNMRLRWADEEEAAPGQEGHSVSTEEIGLRHSPRSPLPTRRRSALRTPKFSSVLLAVNAPEGEPKN